MKVFDIYLRDRVRRCDFIVYNIPATETVSASNQLLLSSCIEEYKILKQFAISEGVEIVSHVDEMLKYCCEKLYGSLCLNCGVDAAVQYRIDLEESGIDIRSQLSLTEIVSRGVTGSIVLDVDMDIVNAKPLGDMSVGMMFCQDNLSTDSYSIVRINDGIGMMNTLIDGVTLDKYVKVQPEIDVSSHLEDLLYLQTLSLNGGVVVSGEVESISISQAVSAELEKSELWVDSAIVSLCGLELFYRGDQGIQIGFEGTTCATMDTVPFGSVIECRSESDSVMARYRYLTELSELTLDSMDESVVAPEKNYTLREWDCEVIVGNKVVMDIEFMMNLGQGDTDLSFFAEDGMTWEEWVKSDYNTCGLCVVGDLVFTSDGARVVVDLASMQQANKSDLIVHLAKYYIVGKE